MLEPWGMLRGREAGCGMDLGGRMRGWRSGGAARAGLEPESLLVDLGTGHGRVMM